MTGFEQKLGEGAMKKMMMSRKRYKRGKKYHPP